MPPSNPFCSAINQFADRLALIHPDGEFTYKELDKLEIDASVDNPDEGFGNQIESILGEQSLSEYAQIFRCFVSGKPYFPVNPKFPAERIEKIHSSVKQFIDESRLDSQSDALSSLAYIIFTSGSTGEPKGVPITQSQLANYSAILQDILAINENDRVLQLGDFSFDISIMAMAIAWPNGAALCAVPSAHVLMASRYAEDQNMTIWLSVPSVVGLAAKAGLLKPNSLPNIRIAIFGGEALTSEILHTFSEAAPNARLFNFWGPTEGTISLSHFEIDRSLLDTSRDDLAITPIGHAHPGVELALWDEDGSTFVSELGHLCASSNQLTQGYLNRPDLSEAAFFMHQGKRWYRTGDLASFDSRYGYRYLGRIDRQIKFKGYRIELQECETALRIASHCQDVCVVPWRDKGSEFNTSLAIKGLVGFMIAPEGINPDKNWLVAIEEQLQAILPGYMIPSRLIVLDALPLNLSGKIDYKVLERKASELA